MPNTLCPICRQSIDNTGMHVCTVWQSGTKYGPQKGLEEQLAMPNSKKEIQIKDFLEQLKTPKSNFSDKDRWLMQWLISFHESGKQEERERIVKIVEGRRNKVESNLVETQNLIWKTGYNEALNDILEKLKD